MYVYVRVNVGICHPFIHPFTDEEEEDPILRRLKQIAFYMFDMWHLPLR